MALYTDYKDAETTAIDAAAINHAIKNILLTPLGSLPGKPTFGSDLYRIPFSHLDHITRNLATRYIKEALRIWEQRITVLRIVYNEAPEYNRITATIFYEYNDRGIQLNESVSFNLI